MLAALPIATAKCQTDVTSQNAVEWNCEDIDKPNKAEYCCQRLNDGAREVCVSPAPIVATLEDPSRRCKKGFATGLVQRGGARDDGGQRRLGGGIRGDICDAKWARKRQQRHSEG